VGEFEQEIESVEIVPSGGGVFEVTIDGDLIYSKKKTGRHAKPGEILAAMRPRR
jgi:selenoprotein W-related protein